MSDEHELPPLETLATRYPEGTELRSVCPDCLSVGECVIDKTWCYWCLIRRDAWIRVAWGEAL